MAKFKEALPKAATDHRISVFRLKGARGTRQETRAVVKILLSELEEVASQGGDVEEHIIDVIKEKAGDDSARYICVPQDSHGKRLITLATWEVAINWEDHEMEEEFEHYVEETGAFNPAAPFGTVPPPAPPVGGEDSALREAQQFMADRRQAEREAEQSHNAMMMQMMNQQQQQQQANATMMMQMMMQQQQERDRQEQVRREEERRYAEERRREEERRADERRLEEQRRAESRAQLMATLVPAAAPLFQKMMEGKEDKITPILLTKLMDNDNNRSGTADMIQLMSEASRQQVISQGEMMRQSMAQQGEMSQSMISHVLSMAQKSVEAQQQLDSSKEEGPMDTFLNVIQGVAPLLQSAQAPAAPAPQMMAAPPIQPVSQAAPPIQAQAVPAQAPQGAPPPAPAGPPTRESHPHYSDEDWVRGAVRTIKDLQQGAIQADKRPAVSEWVASVLPAPVLDSIAAGDHDAVMQQCAPAVMQDQALVQWIMEEESQEFLMMFLQDIGESPAPTAPPSEPAEPSSKIPPPPLEDSMMSEVISEESEDFPSTNGPEGDIPADVVTEGAEGEDDGDAL
ncbi:MAG: hypothetical protein F6K48_02920 [Okeania sp. SIO3H1]|nr:hypothetical protein [Okeania sp. SIO3H1]